MKTAIGVLLAFALAAPVAAQGWQGHIRRDGEIVIQADPPPAYPPYPFSHVDYYPGRASDHYRRRGVHADPATGPDRNAQVLVAQQLCDQDE